MSDPKPIPFDNTYIQLPEHFYSRHEPANASAPHIIRTNGALARKLGIDEHWFTSEDAIAVFAGNKILPGSEPIATVYAAHQFGGWNPQLGDGRALLLGEVIGTDGQRYDIQLKGSGRTRYSRSGDGLSPLGPVLREYIISEAMAALGIPTTRSLAAVTTGNNVIRDQVLPGAILTRVARSHIRVGHFQYFSSRGDTAAVKILADHLIARDFPNLVDTVNPYAELLEQAISRQVRLIVQWQLVGFIHGVMNTDNMLVAGETIDYGPCAFMDEYDPTACYSSIDHSGRYSYKNQPPIAQWNLSWLAQSLLPLIDENQTQAVETAQNMLSAFASLYQQEYTTGLLNKLGLLNANPEALSLTEEFLTTMAAEKQDFTLTFRHLADAVSDENPERERVDVQLPDRFKPLISQWQKLLQQEGRKASDIQQQMDKTNPAFIPRNHLVEAAIQAAQLDGDLRPFHRLVDRLAEPYTYTATDYDLAQPPRPEQVVRQTFCGT